IEIITFQSLWLVVVSIFKTKVVSNMLKLDSGFLSPFNIMMFVRMIFGNYHPIAKSKLISIFLKLYCVSVAFVLIWCTAVYFEFYLILTFHCIINIIFNLITNEKYLIKYYNTIKINDVIMGFKKTSELDKRIAYVVTILFFIKLATYAVYYFVSTNRTTGYFTLFVSYSIDLNYIAIVMIFALMYDRMGLLKIYLEGVTTSVIIVQRDEIAANIRRVKKFLKYYNNLLDNFDFIETQLQCSVCTIFIINKIYSLIISR
ncbi:hypothetical protein O3G_MSEX002933, partial [Manduca sexta]